MDPEGKAAMLCQGSDCWYANSVITKHNNMLYLIVGLTDSRIHHKLTCKDIHHSMGSLAQTGWAKEQKQITFWAQAKIGGNIHDRRTHVAGHLPARGV